MLAPAAEVVIHVDGRAAEPAHHGITASVFRPLAPAAGFGARFLGQVVGSFVPRKRRGWGSFWTRGKRQATGMMDSDVIFGFELQVLMWWQGAILEHRQDGNALKESMNHQINQCF